MFDAQSFIEESIEELKAKITQTAIIACSGGVDSTVAAVLAHRAVGDLLHCVYVDTGFMRKGETQEVEQMFADAGIDLITVDASDRYFDALKELPNQSTRER